MEPPIPKYDELIWPTLQAVRELGGSGNISEIVNKVIEIEGFTEQQQNVPHNQGPTTKIEYRAAWARSHLKGIGALENSARGVWSITERGLNLTPEELPELLAAYRAQLRTKTGSTGAAERDGMDQAAEDGPDEEQDWKGNLLATLLEISPDAFERLAIRLLREAGFTKLEVSGGKGDGGIDGTGVLKVSLLQFPVYVQCKRWRDGPVPAGAVRDFRGAMAGRGDHGLLITTSRFTADAVSESTRPGAQQINLVDGDRLCDLLKDYNVGVDRVVVESVSVDQKFFEDL